MLKLIRAGFMSKLFAILVLSLLLTSGAKAGCDDAPVDGVDILIANSQKAKI